MDLSPNTWQHQLDSYSSFNTSKNHLGAVQATELTLEDGCPQEWEYNSYSNTFCCYDYPSSTKRQNALTEMKELRDAFKHWSENGECPLSQKNATRYLQVAQRVSEQINQLKLGYSWADCCRNASIQKFNRSVTAIQQSIDTIVKETIERTERPKRKAVHKPTVTTPLLSPLTTQTTPTILQQPIQQPIPHTPIHSSIDSTSSSFTNCSEPRSTTQPQPQPHNQFTPQSQSLTSQPSKQPSWLGSPNPTNSLYLERRGSLKRITSATHESKINQQLASTEQDSPNQAHAIYQNRRSSLKRAITATPESKLTQEPAGTGIHLYRSKRMSLQEVQIMTVEQKMASFDQSTKLLEELYKKTREELEEADVNSLEYKFGTLAKEAILGGATVLKDNQQTLIEMLTDFSDEEFTNLVSLSCCWVLIWHFPSVFSEKLTANHFAILFAQEDRAQCLVTVLDKIPKDEHYFDKLQAIINVAHKQMELALNIGAQNLSIQDQDRLIWG